LNAREIGTSDTQNRGSTRARVEKFIENLAKLLLSKIRDNNVLSLTEVYLYATGTAKPLDNVPPKLYGLFLLNQLRRLRDVLLDKAAEAISSHVDRIDNDFIYAELSASIMRYAIHELNLLQTIIDYLEKSLKEENSYDTEFLEEFVFSTLARFMAVMALISRLDPRELEKILNKLTKILDYYIAEELTVFREKVDKTLPS